MARDGMYCSGVPRCNVCHSGSRDCSLDGYKSHCDGWDHDFLNGEGCRHPSLELRVSYVKIAGLRIAGVYRHHLPQSLAYRFDSLVHPPAPPEGYQANYCDARLTVTTYGSCSSVSESDMGATSASSNSSPLVMLSLTSSVTPAA